MLIAKKHFVLYRVINLSIFYKLNVCLCVYMSMCLFIFFFFLFFLCGTASITKNKLYRKVFGNAIIEARMVAQNIFVSARRYNGCLYNFRTLSDKSLLIVECAADDIKMELIPPDSIDKGIPLLLRTKYSHWWNETANFIEFRVKRFMDEDFKTNIEYKLDLDQLRLEHIRTKRYMLDVTSESHVKLATHLKRLECDEFMHIYIDADEKVDERGLTAQIELIRLNLKFETRISDECTDLVAKEFSDMKVSLNQNCGSLYGLRKGLILEAIANDAIESTSSNILLIPHGSIIVRNDGNHVDVDIGTDAEQSTKLFHRYEIDKMSQQIRSSTSSYSTWLYLAYLHAITSHGEIEPLLAMSGIERALQILQSG